jgi:DNA (cytosine-5)-methyltransferase 1
MNSLNKSELLEKCKELGFTKYKSLNKSALIELIKTRIVDEEEVEEEAIKEPEPEPLTTKLKLCDLFTGTGAITLAFEKSGRVECVFANDIEPSSKQIYETNFSHQLLLQNLNDIDVATIPAHDILTGGFPCFVAGSPTLTCNGYKRIEDVDLTDRLLTHTGTFQKIVNLQQKNYSGKLFDIDLIYHPEIITATEEHPFYVRMWNNYMFEPPVWKKANELTMNDHFGMVINKNEIIPEFTIGKESVKLDNPDYWFMLGYFVGARIDANDERISHFIWHIILKKFGEHDKLIPEWVQDAPKKFIQEFINGYMRIDDVFKASPILAYGLQRLHLKLGDIVFEGSSFIENNYVWFEPLNISTRDAVETPVYNFEVENDNSYIVANVCVHNCQPFSIAGKQAGFEDLRSNVFWKMLEIIDYHQPPYIILENVKNLVSHDNQKTFETIRTELEKRGYFIHFKVLNTADITGVPQNRERIYIVCFKSKEMYDKFSLEFPKIEKKQITDLLEPHVAERYYYTDKSSTWGLVSAGVVKPNTVYQYRRVYVRENKSSECPTLTANMGSGGHNVPLILDTKGVRKLTPRECFNFQGFPQTYILPPTMSDSKLYKLAGNAVSVPVINLIVDRLMSII